MQVSIHHFPGVCCLRCDKLDNENSNEGVDTHFDCQSTGLGRWGVGADEM